MRFDGIKKLFNGSNFKIFVTLTWSKFMAFYIVSLGFILEYAKDVSGVFMLSVGAATGLLINKQYQDRKIEIKKTETENK